MTDVQRYAQYADTYEAAYAAFMRTYAVRNPPPARDVAVSTSRRLRWLVGGMALASIIVSAFHTLPVFVPAENMTPLVYVVAVAVFVMVELGLVITSYVSIQYFADDKPLHDTARLVTFARRLLFALAVTVNVYSVMRGQAYAAGGLWNFLDVGITIFVGISAPVMVLITGDVIAVTLVQDRRAQAALDAQYEEALSAWRAGLDRAWSASRTRKAVKVEVPGNSIPGLSNGNVGMENAGNRREYSSGGTPGHSKRPNASDVVRQHLETNPDDASANPFELAERLGVGKSTVYNVLKEWRQN